MNALEIFMNLPEEAEAGELAAYLEEACGGNGELRAEVEALIAKDSEGSAFMRSPALDRPVDNAGGEEAGGVIGHYKLLQEIGTGGFGVVYMAEQLAPVKRRVALKIIKQGMDTKQVVARFEVERQALAMMDHPNIAKVYDAGATKRGRPYFVMELVRGLPVTEFCEEEKLGLRGRLELFIDVCGAIRHAHQKGIIHRDLKPSNVIVTIHDDKAVPKVIDFGVAKAIQQDLTDKTLFTRFEQFIGTPAYMSPEQCQLGGLDIDTRSDIYSLGVLLYELLTGTTPIDGKQLARSSQEEIRRAIREVEPMTPSTRHTGTRKRGRESSGGNPRRVVSEIDRELDWIVMKALEKDRKRRYETVGSLAADVRRHLDCEPVEAGPPGVAYRIGKVVRRHRAAVVTAAAMLALLVAGVAVSSWQWLRASQSEAEVVVERDRARDSEERALRGERVAQHRVAEELFAGGKIDLAIVHLARLVRENPNNRVAGERLMSALRHHPIPRRLSPPLAESFRRKAVSPDGEYLLSYGRGVTPGHGIHRTDGEPSRFPLVPSMDGFNPAAQSAFNPTGDRQVIVAYVDSSAGFAGAARLWDLEKNAQIGESVEFDNSIHEVDFSPDGELVYAAAFTNSFRVWSTRPGGEIDWTGRVDRRIEAVAFSPDSRLIAVGGTGGSVTLWDAAGGREIVPAIEHASTVRAIGFDPASERVITGGANGVAEIWDVATGESTGVRIAHPSAVRAVEFSLDGRAVLTGTQDGEIRVWDAESGQAIGDEMSLGGLLRSAHFDRSGARVVAGTFQRFKVWSLASAEPLGGLGSGHSIHDVYFEDDANQVFVCDDRSQRWVTPNDRPLCRVFRHGKADNNNGRGPVSTAKFGGDGRYLVTAGYDNSMRLWEVATAREVTKFGVDNIVSCAELRPDGEVAVSAAHSGAILWDVASGKRIRQLRRGRIPQAIFSPVRDAQGRWRVATTSTGRDACVELWDGATGEPIGAPLSLAPSNGSLTWAGLFGTLFFSRDGDRLAAFDGKNTVRLWDVSGDPGSWHLIRQISQEGKYWGLGWSPDERRMVIYGRDDRLRVRDVGTGEVTGSVVAHSNGMVSAWFNPSGDRIVTASADQTARIWDAATLAPVGVPMRHDGVVILARFDPDGRRVVTTSIDGTARVWDAGTGFPLSGPLRHDGQALYAEFSPDGRQVVTTGEDSTARVWDVPPAPADPVPDWVAGWAEALVGLRLMEDGIEVKVSWEEAQRLEAVARQAGGDAFYGRTMQWIYEYPATRSISPFCEYSVSDYVADRLNETGSDGLPLEDSLEEVLRIDPQNPEAMAKLAEFLLEAERGDKAGDRVRARHFASLASSWEPENARYADLVGRAEEALEAGEVFEEIASLEERAREAIGNGDRREGEAQMELATLKRLRVAAGGHWLGEQERAEVFANWSEVLPREVLVGKGERWRYYDRGQPLGGSDWRALGFEDGGWDEGAAPLGFSKEGEDGEVTLLKEGEEGSERVTFYFRKQFQYAGDEKESEGEGKALLLSLRRDDGAVVYLNGQEILRSNMPAGVIDEETLAASTVSGEGEKAFREEWCDAGLLRAGENVVAVEVHQVKPGSSDVGFDLEIVVGEDPVERFKDGVSGMEMDPATRARMLWVLGDNSSALDAIDVVLEPLVGALEPAEVRSRKEWLRRKADVLGSLGRTGEEMGLRDRVAAVWERAPGTPAGMVDLSDVYNRGVMGRYAPPRGSANDWIERLPETFDPGDGPGFDIRGSVRLNSGVYAEGIGAISGKDHNSLYGTDFGMSVRIAIGQPARVLHFLHGCDWGAAEPGEVVATYVVHFDDGSSESVPVRYGEDILADWVHALDPLKNEALGALVWEKRFRQDNQQNGRVGYVVMRWENVRQPEKEITHIDFVSEGKQAAPYLLGVTLE